MIPLKVKYCLTQWGHFMRDKEELSESEKEVARSFFRAIAGLSNTDITLLSEKYVTGDKTAQNRQTGLYQSDRSRTDHELAALHNIPYLQYSQKRVAIEKKLQKLLDKTWQQEQKARDPDEFYLYVAGMWLISVKESSTTTLTLTDFQLNATKYNKANGDRIAKKYNCKKIAITKDY